MFLCRRSTCVKIDCPVLGPDFGAPTTLTQDPSSSDTAKQRLDQELVGRGLVPSRARARDLIIRGLVTVNGTAATKPGLQVGADTLIAVAEGAALFVSRGGDKLVGALDAFQFDAKGAIALDVGASTGGFTDVLLQRGAAKVYAVDVGHGQLHPSLLANPKVISFEGTDSRRIDHVLIPDPVNAIVADVSFISLLKALPNALHCAGPACWLVALIKPQFEAGRGAISKGGIVRFAADRERAVRTVTDWLTTDAGWQVVGVIPSPITGSDGNQEYLVGARKLIA
jgi:23S rRNA (cytidine1920-2'-O)/16S rRNA (cytidine1409-2'-O)-methyltransferase